MALAEQESPGRTGPSREERRSLQLASEGVGELLQRDFVIVVEGSPTSPEEAALLMRSDFPRFSPSELAAFSRPEGDAGPLEVGDTMHVVIRGAGHCGVVVSHVEPRSFTMRTLKGHPEAGRITFGAYRDEGGRLVCRIRSRSRLPTPARYVAYKLLGLPMQTVIWTTFARRAAEACGGRPLGDVIVQTDVVADEPADLGHVDEPTFSTASPR